MTIETQITAAKGDQLVHPGADEVRKGWDHSGDLIVTDLLHRDFSLGDGAGVINRNGDFLVTASSTDGDISVAVRALGSYSAESIRELNIPIKDAPVGIDIDDQGRFVVVGTKEWIHVLDLYKPGEELVFSSKIFDETRGVNWWGGQSVDLDSEGKTLVAVTSNDRDHSSTVRVFSRNEHNEWNQTGEKTFGGGNLHPKALLGPDGSTLLFNGGGPNLLVYQIDEFIGDKNPKPTFVSDPRWTKGADEYQIPIEDFAVSRDGRFVAVASRERIARAHLDEPTSSWSILPGRYRSYDQDRPIDVGAEWYPHPTFDSAGNLAFTNGKSVQIARFSELGEPEVFCTVEGEKNIRDVQFIGSEDHLFLKYIDNTCQIVYSGSKEG